MSDISECNPHKSDYENYYYFALNLTTEVIPEPPPTTYLARLSQRIPQIEYLGNVGHLADVVQVRVKKDDDVDLETFKKALEMVNGVESVEFQVPKKRNKKVL